MNDNLNTGMSEIRARSADEMEIRNIAPVELNAVSGGLVTMLYDVTVGGIRYSGWMNDNNGDWIIDVGGPGSGRGYVSKGGFNPN
jgi:hypothetical protein